MFNLKVAKSCTKFQTMACLTVQLTRITLSLPCIITFEIALYTFKLEYTFEQQPQLKRSSESIIISQIAQNCCCQNQPDCATDSDAERVDPSSLVGEALVFKYFGQFMEKQGPRTFCDFCSEALQQLLSPPCVRPAHVAKSWPLALLQVLQNSRSLMFMLRVKTLRLSA